MLVCMQYLYNSIYKLCYYNPNAELPHARSTPIDLENIGNYNIRLYLLPFSIAASMSLYGIHFLSFLDTWDCILAQMKVIAWLFLSLLWCTSYQFHKCDPKISFCKCRYLQLLSLFAQKAIRCIIRSWYHYNVGDFILQYTSHLHISSILLLSWRKEIGFI